MSAKAIITRINTFEHPNADRIQLGMCSGFQVVTGLDTEDGQLGIFFPSDTQLSHKMCDKNNLYREHPKTGEKMGGFFEKNRRVRVQKFRGERSEGFWMPLEALEWTGVDTSELQEGDLVSCLRGEEVVRKYVSPATKTSTGGGKAARKSKVSYKAFPKHIDTDKLRYVIGNISCPAYVSFSEKLHGTSGRTGRVKVAKELKGFKRIWNVLSPSFLPKYPDQAFRYVTGSRNVPFDPDSGEEDYGKDLYRFKVHQRIKQRGLRKREILYYEIVGFNSHNPPIMHSHGIEDKELKKVYGDHMEYSYGCAPHSDTSFEVYVYRIVQDGQDLSPSAMRKRCTQLGLEYVPPLGSGVYKDPMDIVYAAEELSRGASTLDPTHIREGVCARIEQETSSQVVKYKSFEFCELEDIQKKDPDLIDVEESS